MASGWASALRVTQTPQRAHAVPHFEVSETANTPLIRPVGHLLPLNGGRRDITDMTETKGKVW
jgi:hypothetical protein